MEYCHSPYLVSTGLVWMPPVLITFPIIDDRPEGPIAVDLPRDVRHGLIPRLKVLMFPETLAKQASECF